MIILEKYSSILAIKTNQEFDFNTTCDVSNMANIWLNSKRDGMRQMGGHLSTFIFFDYNLKLLNGCRMNP